ncbi:MAG TPA: hypothetical protein VFT82_02155 [Candidatus Paceibacterota bacterium]|nr:hypothetical protein [Candidatus Paceibacterota bacterium]
MHPHNIPVPVAVIILAALCTLVAFGLWLMMDMYYRMGRDPDAPEKCPHCGGTNIRKIDVAFDYRNDPHEPDDFVVTHSYGCRKCDTNIGSKTPTHMTEEEFRKKYPFEYARSESGSWQVLV